MARKKCSYCLSCFNVVWVNNNRFYHCWLCNTWYGGRDSELVQVPSPYNTPVPIEELKEQEDDGQPIIQAD